MSDDQAIKNAKKFLADVEKKHGAGASNDLSKVADELVKLSAEARAQAEKDPR